MASPAAVLNIIVTANNTQATGALTATQAQLKRTAAVADTSTARISRSASAAGARMATMGKVAAVGLGAAAVASTKLAVDFERGMRNVNSIAQLPERQFKKLSNEVLNLAGKTAQAPKTLAEGLYDLVSSGFDARESMEILGKSARAATAGLTDTATSTKAVAAVLNAYRLDAKDAGDVSDILFRTVDRGVISFEELASNIGQVLPAAAALDVDLAQVGASVATLTKQGQSGSSAIVNLNQAMTALFKPSEAMKDALDSLGVESAVTLTKTKGLQGALEAVIGATDGSKEAIGELFPNVRALRAVFGLTGKNAKGAAEDIAAMQDATGATARALSQQSKSLAFQWQKFTADLQASAIRIGQDVIPELQALLAIITDKRLDPSEKVALLGEKIAQAIKRWLPKIAEAGVAIGAALLKGIADAFLNSSLIGKLGIGLLLIRMIGGKGAILTVGRTIAGWLVAGVGASLAGTASYSAIGTALGAGIAKAAAVALPAGIAAVGLGNILSSALGGDMREAGFKAGGSIAGAIAGGLIGGLPGALIGGGLGSLLGGALEGAFEPARRMQERIAEASGRVDKALRNQRAAMDLVRASSKQLTTARQSEQKAANRVERAEEARNRALRQYGRNAPQTIEAERDLARARRGLAQATNRAERAEKLHGIEKKAAKAVTRDAVAAHKDEIWTLQREVKNRREALRAAVDAEQGEGKALRRLQDAKNRLREATQSLNRTIGQAADNIGPKFAKSLDRIDSEMKQANQSMVHAKKGVTQFRRETQDAGGVASRFAQNTKTMGERLKNPLNPNLRTASGLASRFGAGFSEAASTAYSGMQNIAGNVTRMSKGLDGDAPEFGLKAPKKGGGGGPGQRPGAQTGWHVPGSGSGDTVPAMLEPGEFVLNRKAVQAVGAAKLERLNFDIAPRFAAGGIVELGRQLQREGYEVGENPAFGGVDPVHVAGSYHYSGQALDVNDDLAPFAVPGGETASLTSLYNRLKGMAGVVELLWQVPNHYDHLHVAMAKGADAALTGRGGQLAQIKRQIVQGPEGALKDMAQGAIDMTTKMANDYLGDFGGSVGGFGGSGTYDVPTLERLWTAVNRGLADAHIMAAVAMGESGGNPRAIGHDPGGTTGLGLWQITTGYNDALIARLGGVNAMLDPVKNAKAAGEIFRSQGYGAWVVYNEGIYQRWMQLGGMIEKLAGGGSPGKGGKGGKGGKDDDKPTLIVTGGGSGGGPDSPPGSGAMNIFSPDLPGVGGYGYAGGPTAPPGDYVPAANALPDLAALMNSIWIANGNDARRKALSGALGQVRAWGLAADKATQIDSLTTAAATYGAWADRASAVVGEDDPPGSGIVAGANEVQHLTNQLTRLFELRNALIDAERIIDQKVKELQAFIAKVKQRMDEIRRKIDKVAKEREKVKDEIGKIKDDKKRDEDDVKRWEGKLAEELKRKPKDQDQGRIKDLRAKIWAGRARIADAPKKIAKVEKQLAKIDDEQARRAWQRDQALTQLVSVGEDEKLQDLIIQRDNMVLALQTVQDVGSPMETMTVAQGMAMPFGTFGGDIFNAQQRLRDIAAARAEKEESAAPTPMNIADLLEFAQAVKLGAFRKGGKIPAYAMGGYHAAGGLALVGERGPELATLPAGTRVHSNQDSQSMFSPTIYADIYIGGEKIAEKVAVQTRAESGATLGRWRAGTVRR